MFFFSAFLATPVWPIGPKGPLSHLARPWGGPKSCIFQHFWPPQRAPRSPKELLGRFGCSKTHAFMCFPHPETQIATKTRVLGISTPPKRPLGAPGQKWPREQSKMLSWSIFRRAVFLKICPCTQTPYTQKHKPHTHIHTNTPIVLPPCAGTHTRIHTNTPIVLPPCAYTHTHIQTNLSPVAIYSKFNRCATYAMSF